MLNIELTHSLWPLTFKFKNRWIHPRNCQNCFVLCSTRFIKLCSSLKPFCPFSKRPGWSVLWRIFTHLQRLSAALYIVFSLFLTYVLLWSRTWIPGFGPCWEVMVSPRVKKLSVEWDVLDLPCWQIAGNPFLELLLHLCRLLFNLRWIAAPHGFIESLRLPRSHTRLEDLCNNFQLTFLTVGCLSRDVWHSSYHKGTRDLYRRWHSFIRIHQKINSFWREKWNHFSTFWETCMILFLTVKSLTLDVR